MNDQNAVIQAMAGTSTVGAATSSTHPALKSIATNGSLLVQGVSNLDKTLSNLLTAWGA